MKLSDFSTAIIVVAGLSGTAAAQDKGKQKAPPKPGLTLTSRNFEDGGIIPKQYTQSVASPISPQLLWTNIPDGTASFVLLVHDPDAALQRKINDVTHWLVFNIPGTARQLVEGIPPTPKMADGMIQLKNNGGVVGYRGMGAPAVGP